MSYLPAFRRETRPTDRDFGLEKKRFANAISQLYLLLPFSQYSPDFISKSITEICGQNSIPVSDFLRSLREAFQTPPRRKVSEDLIYMEKNWGSLASTLSQMKNEVEEITLKNWKPYVAPPRPAKVENPILISPAPKNPEYGIPISRPNPSAGRAETLNSDPPTISELIQEAENKKPRCITKETFEQAVGKAVSEILRSVDRFDSTDVRGILIRDFSFFPYSEQGLTSKIGNYLQRNYASLDLKIEEMPTKFGKLYSYSRNETKSTVGRPTTIEQREAFKLAMEKLQSEKTKFCTPDIIDIISTKPIFEDFTHRQLASRIHSFLNWKAAKKEIKYLGTQEVGGKYEDFFALD